MIVCRASRIWIAAILAFISLGCGVPTDSVAQTPGRGDTATAPSSQQKSYHWKLVTAKAAFAPRDGGFVVLVLFRARCSWSG